MLVCHYKETIIHVHQGIQIIGVIFQYFPQAFMHERIYEAEFIEKGDGKFCEKVDNDFPILSPTAGDRFTVSVRNLSPFDPESCVRISISSLSLNLPVDLSKSSTESFVMVHS